MGRKNSCPIVSEDGVAALNGCNYFSCHLVKYFLGNKVYQYYHQL